MRRSPMMRSLVVLALAATFVAGTALADFGPLLTIQELTDSTSVVVKGRVQSVDAGWDLPAELIYTYVTIEVDEILRGDVPHEQIVVKQLHEVYRA